LTGKKLEINYFLFTF